MFPSLLITEAERD